MDSFQVGDYVEVNSPEHWAHREWGVVRRVEGNWEDGYGSPEYHVGMWGEDSRAFLFYEEELKPFDYEGC
jgi:hypothetical protein